MIDEITIECVQGVGDCHWVISKLAPHVKKINMQILCIDKGIVQTRAKKFIERLPNVAKIDYKVVSSPYYDRVAHTYHPIQKLLDDPKTIYPYAVNEPLERGVRLENIDPGYDVQWTLDYGIKPDKIRTDKYIALYVSGNKADKTWDTNAWTQFVVDLCKQHKLWYPIVLLGASYDALVLNVISNNLRRRGYRTEVMIDNGVEDCIRLIRDAALFIGYQSGLSILADNYDVKQIMLYFPWLKPMLNTWCKPGHAESGLFNGFTFDQSPQEIISKIVL